VTTIYDRLGVARLVNAAGKLTAFGGSAQSEDVAAAQAEAARAHVELQALRDAVGARIATLTGAERACVTSGAAAGIAISVAACITGTDLARVQRLPESDGLANGVLLQAGHDIDFGAPVVQMVRLGGGEPRIVGTRERVTVADLDRALADRSALAAFLYVQSHHCLQHGRLSLADCIARCRAKGLPVIVDAAAEEDLRHYVAVGADLVTYSGGKAFGGPTSGFVAGRADLVAACELQQRGIARAMKVGKETLAGLAVALERYAARDASVEAAQREAVLSVLEEGLARIAGVAATRHADEAGRDIERVALRLPGRDLAAVIRALADGRPSIRTRNHHLKEGYVLIDPRELDVDQARTIVARVAEVIAQ
jgi:L-seryl-tRNA(Ser) seleniumtransferase/D-glucosaminate-6-phosphate ammonia-lyase